MPGLRLGVRKHVAEPEGEKIMNAAWQKSLAPLAFVVLVVNAVSLSAQEPAAEETRYVLDDLKVELVFPGKPREKSLDNGKSVSLGVMNGKAFYFFQYSMLPNQVDALGDKAVAKKILDAGREGALRNLDGSKLLVERDYLHNMKYPSRDIRIEDPGLGIYRTLVILTPTHLFQMIVAGPADFTDAAPAKRFLDSFKIKK
jgi:hypothetical protein